MSKEQNKKSYRELRLILGDQLNLSHSWFTRVDDNILYVMMEIRPESEYATHHIQKVAGIFTAMRNFSTALGDQGHQVRYFKITDDDNRHSFEKNIGLLSAEYHVQRIKYQEPDEYRLDRLLHRSFQAIDLPFEVVSSEHFYTSRNQFGQFFKGKKQYLMESFYRHMRKKHEVLMGPEGTSPEGGKWNYDKSNRKKLPASIGVPEPIIFQHDVSAVCQEIEDAGLQTIGRIGLKSFIWPTCREEALKSFEYFTEYLLPKFGTYQDALSEKYWSLFHSRISFALNLKMLHPREVVEAVEMEYRRDPDRVSIQQAEGFIRQILGWREYMRGIYWNHMPEYNSMNYFEASRPLPGYFWTGETRMQCVQSAIHQSLEYGYAHHIQRLMVTGNFCALAGIDPDEVDAWYLGIYVDAFDWVEITNTRGMSQFADGGIVGTKPYVSSASYLHKMGDHCTNCHYDHKKKTGEKACPFNSLYWNFLDRNETKLKDNPRMSLMYGVWGKMDADKRAAILKQADRYLEEIESL